jgi:hypothetical protein
VSSAGRTPGLALRRAPVRMSGGAVVQDWVGLTPVNRAYFTDVVLRR